MKHKHKKKLVPSSHYRSPNDISSRLPIDFVLPRDIVIMIFSQLPVRFVARLQFECKEWHALIHDRYFNQKLMEHSEVACYYRTGNLLFDKRRYEPHEPLRFVDGCDGLLFVWSDLLSKHFIWNPVIRRFLEVPNPHQYSYGFVFSYVPATRNYKLVSIYNDKESEILCCEIFIPGHSTVWRRCSTFPEIVKLIDAEKKISRVSVVLSGVIVYCVILIKDGYNIFDEVIIVALDLGNERCTTSIISLGKDIFENWKSVWAIDWDGKLALYQIVGQNLQMMVLEDYKRHKWCEKTKIIPLPVIYGNERELFPLFAKDGDVWFWLKDNQLIFSYTIRSGCHRNYLQLKTPFALDDKLFLCKGSMISFEGMISHTMFKKMTLRDVVVFEEEKKEKWVSPFSFYWGAIGFACLVAFTKCIRKLC